MSPYDINPDEIKLRAKGLKNNKTFGPDRTPIEVIKTASLKSMEAAWVEVDSPG